MRSHHDRDPRSLHSTASSRTNGGASHTGSPKAPQCWPAGKPSLTHAPNPKCDACRSWPEKAWKPVWPAATQPGEQGQALRPTLPFAGVLAHRKRFPFSIKGPPRSTIGMHRKELVATIQQAISGQLNGSRLVDACCRAQDGIGRMSPGDSLLTSRHSTCSQCIRHDAPMPVTIPAAVSQREWSMPPRKEVCASSHRPTQLTTCAFAPT